MKKSDIGMIGLAVMGENLARNMENKGYQVSLYDIRKGVANKLSEREMGKNFVATNDIQEFIDSIKKPRKIMMMIRAGKPVDQVIEQLLPLLDGGDIIIDGGNSHFPDTSRRTKYVEEHGCYFIGTGVSGGEEGALHGPSLMPGGSYKAWQEVKTIFQEISAKVNGDSCCAWVGKEGAGHFVKMVHNGIEYGDMQLIGEAYALMKDLLGLSADEIGEVFSEWNKGKLDSYLIEITADILKYKDEDGSPLVDKILDCTGQKGTGKWTGIEALDEGIPLTLIGEAVFSRCLSAMKEERVIASKEVKTNVQMFRGDKEEFILLIKEALYASKIISYAQGYTLLRNASIENGWDLKYGEIAFMWRGGCIIRSAFLGQIKKAFDKNEDLPNLILDGFFKAEIAQAEMAWRKVCSTAMLHGVSIPAMTSALTYFDGYRTETLAANLLQAQRDYFGAHTYERVDKERGEFFHTNWTGKGGDTSSSTYDV